MKHEKILRLALLAAVSALHILLILFLVIDTAGGPGRNAEERARVMKLVDVEELPPPPPPPEEEKVIPQVEAIAETIIETDTEPVQMVVAPGALTVTTPVIIAPEEEYLPQHMISVQPVIDRREITSRVVYPPIAQRSGIEGRVILELFIDRTGLVRDIKILREEPPDRGFGEAAVKAFTGYKAVPAQANGEAVSCRMRWPVSFVLK
jgi:protein TonB